jgi:ribosomal protein S18 acetylase RimI-like enzyme
MRCQEIQFGSQKYHKSIKLRYKILREPLGLSYTSGNLAEEKNQFHLGISDEENNILAIILLKKLGNGRIKMRQFAVDDKLQRKGLGTKLVRFSEQFARDRGFSKIELNARQSAVAFYKKLDYRIVSEEFIEVGIPHYKMEKTI